MVKNSKHQKGFTIVELLVVIVVIGILAAITIVAYNGIQVRARDAQRSSDISAILKSLEIYKINSSTGAYPTATGQSGGWEYSNDPPGTFMEYLGLPKTPTDPVNNATYRYWYYRYAPGTNGCDANMGGYFILWATFESAANKPKGKTFLCGTYSAYDNGTTYIYGKFDNE